MDLLVDDPLSGLPRGTARDRLDASAWAGVRVIESALASANLSIIEGAGEAKVLCWPGNGAVLRSLHLITLEGGASTVSLSHASECVYYVIRGAGAIDSLEGDERFDLTVGAMVHIDAGDRYRIRAGDEQLSFVGGPCPPDPALYEFLTSAEGAV